VKLSEYWPIDAKLSRAEFQIDEFTYHTAMINTDSIRYLVKIDLSHLSK